jgi:hypothetical protein
VTGPTVRYTVAFGGRAPAEELPARVPAPREVAPPPPSRAARLLALAHHIERLIDEGALSGYADAARVLGVTRARMTQVMDLLLLPPAVQEGVLTGAVRASERRLRRLTRQTRWGFAECP